MKTRIKILFFGKSRELVGKNETLLEVPIHVTYESLLNLVSTEFNLNLISNNLILALNEEYLSSGQNFKLKELDELAIIPPLSGG